MLKVKVLSVHIDTSCTYKQVLDFSTRHLHNMEAKSLFLTYRHEIIITVCLCSNLYQNKRQSCGFGLMEFHRNKTPFEMMWHFMPTNTFESPLFAAEIFTFLFIWCYMERKCFRLLRTGYQKKAKIKRILWMYVYRGKWRWRRQHWVNFECSEQR